MLNLNKLGHWKDANVGPSDWAKWLFCLGKVCARKRRKDRPKISTIYQAFEALLNDDNPKSPPPPPSMVPFMSLLTGILNRVFQ